MKMKMMNDDVRIIAHKCSVLKNLPAAIVWG